MAKMAWLTPDDDETMSTDCFAVYIPNLEQFRAAFRGTLLLLEQAKNWEQYGDMTPEDAAAYWMTANSQTFNMTPCAGYDMIPVGTIIMGAWSSAPDGYLLCDGGIYDPETYPDLYSAIGDVFGLSGDMPLLPDMRDNFPAGAGDSYALADSGGSAEITLTEAQMPEHEHTNQPMNLRGRGTGSALTWTYQSGDVGVTGLSGGDEPHENRPPFLALNFAIKT